MIGWFKHILKCDWIVQAYKASESLFKYEFGIRCFSETRSNSNLVVTIVGNIKIFSSFELFQEVKAERLIKIKVFKKYLSKQFDNIGRFQ